jgi:HSP20 family protein
LYKENKTMVHFRFPIHQLPSALQDFASEMETIVDQVFKKNECGSDRSDCNEGSDSTYTPSMDIYETENQYDLFLDLPGVKGDAVKLEMQDERLVVTGVREGFPLFEGVQTHRQERVAGKFERSIRMPKLIDAEKIDASFEHGVLHVVLPKQAKPSARSIAIKTA